MRALLTYWVIGCVLVGLVVGDSARDCGGKVPSKFTSERVVAMVAVWPSALGFAIAMRGMEVVHVDVCKEE